jgi:ABC-type branched-subunit amino acid transport system substrate-binding protein
MEIYDNKSGDSMKRVISLLCGLGLFAAAHAETGVSADTILLGQSVVLSGPLAENGQQYTKGIRLYLDQVNKAGGIHGRKIELVTLDDAYSPQKAEENTRQLIEQKQVFALLGYAGTGSAMAALPLAEKSRTPFVAPYSGSDGLRARVSPVLFHLRASYGDEMYKIVEHQTTLGIKDIAIVYQDDNFGKSGLKGLETAMMNLFGMKPAVVVPIDPAKLDATSLAAKVSELAKAKPSAVVLATAGKASSAVIAETLKTGIRPQFIGLSVVSASQLLNDLKGDVAGIIVSQVVPSPWSSKYRIVRQYREALGGKADEAHYASLEGYIAARVMVEGLRRAGQNLTRVGFLGALEGLRRFDLGDFVVDFGNGRHVGSDFVDLSMIRSNGQFVQ